MRATFCSPQAAGSVIQCTTRGDWPPLAETPAADQLVRVFSRFAAVPAMAAGHLGHSAWYETPIWAWLLQRRQAGHNGSQL